MNISFVFLVCFYLWSEKAANGSIDSSDVSSIFLDELLVVLNPARNSDLIELVVALVLPGRATAPDTNLPVSSPSTLEVGFFSFILFFSFFVKIVLVIGRKMGRG
jgi:hypothetical protein